VVVTEATVFTKTEEQTKIVDVLDVNGNPVLDNNGQKVTELKVVKVEVPYTPAAPVSVSAYAGADANRP